MKKFNSPVHPPHSIPPRLCAHCVTTSNRTTSSRTVYQVFWHTSSLTGLDSPARLYRAIGYIGTEPFYETPGAIAPTAASFRRGKAPSSDILYRSFRGLWTRPRAVILRACIPEKPPSAPDGDTARVPYWTPAPGGDTGQTAPGGDTPRHCSHASQTRCGLRARPRAVI